MSPDQFQRVKAIYLQLENAPRETVASELDRLCEGDQVVRDEVESLLQNAPIPDEAILNPVTQKLDRLLLADDAPAPDVIGQRVGPYQVTEMIGQGGMGVVYVGFDADLARKAALKAVLPGDPGNSSNRERLRREARILASLSHPNLVAVYGLEEARDTLYLAMEFVEGMTLSQRLGRGNMTIPDALACCEQIAAGVETAHEAGVVHRDLKPSNIIFTPDGVPKVLDFGLAREMKRLDASHSRSIRHQTLTRQGSFFGTPAYMSPEQARGESLDQRTDIFSFGSIFFRCMTGRPAFEGESDGELVDAILTREPDYSLLPANLPESIRSILSRCLAKNKSERYRHIGDVRLDLRQALVARGWEKPRDGRGRRGLSRWLIPISSVAACVCIGAGAWWLKPQPTVPVITGTVQRFDISLPQEASQGDLERVQLALTPDGQTLVVACSTASGQALWTRSHSDGQWRMIENTQDAHRPFMSSDGQWVGFFRTDHVQKQRLSGRGDPIRLAVATNWYGATWADDGTLIHSPAWDSPLQQSNGADTQPLTTLRPKGDEFAHISPFAVPGTRWVLFNVWTGGEDCQVHAVNLDTKAEHTVISVASGPRVTATPRGDYLLFERASIIFAVPFDRTTAKTTGPETAVADAVMNDGTRYVPYFDVAADGTLAYVPGSSFTEQSRLSYINADGSTKPVNDDRMSYSTPQFGEKSSKMSVGLKGKLYRVMIYDLKQQTKTLLLTGGDTVAHGINPDGTLIACTVNRDGGYGVDLFSLTTGAFVRRLVSPGPDYQSEMDWSGDGKYLTYSMSPKEGVPRDVWIMDADGSTPPRQLVSTRMADVQAVISPSSKWVAYASEETGRREVYLVTCPEGERKRQVSFTGGESPEWSPDGTKLYFISPQGLVTVDVSADGVVMSQPNVIYNKPFGQSDPIGRNYTIAPDGRPVIVEPSERRPTVSHLHVITNWHQLLPK